LNPDWRIQRCLDSVCRESSAIDLEHIVVDGGSTDGTIEILRSFAAQHAWCRFLSEPDDGPYEAINKGFQMAQGRYLLYLSADDMLAPGALTAVRNAIEKRPGAGAFLGRTRFFAADPPAASHVQLPAGDESLIGNVMFFSPCTCSCVISRELLNKVGGYRAIRYATDKDFMIRLAAIHPPDPIEAEIGWFVTHPRSLTGSGDPDAIVESILEHFSIMNNLTEGALGLQLREWLALWRSRELYRLIRHTPIRPHAIRNSLRQVKREFMRDPRCVLNVPRVLVKTHRLKRTFISFCPFFLIRRHSL